MTKDEAVTMLLDRLGITLAAEGEARVAECRAILTDALALPEQLPTDWFEVWELVAELHRRQREGTSGTAHDFPFIFGPLNQAVNTRNVTFPRDFW
jgi:hypothetical protein